MPTSRFLCTSDGLPRNTYYSDCGAVSIASCISNLILSKLQVHVVRAAGSLQKRGAYGGFRRCHGSRNLELAMSRLIELSKESPVVVFRSKTCCSWVGSGDVKGRPKSTS